LREEGSRQLEEQQRLIREKIQLERQQRIQGEIGETGVLSQTKYLWVSNFFIDGAGLAYR